MNVTYRVRIKPNLRHGKDGEFRDGDEITVSAEEFASFRDKFILLERIQETEEVETAVPFDFEGLSVDDIMAAIANGQTTTSEARAYELSRPRKRTSLLKLLEAADAKAVEE